MDGLDDVGKEFSRMEAKAAAMLKNQKELEKGIGKYAEALIAIRKTQNDILHIEEQKIKLEKELEEYKKSIRDKVLRWQKLEKSSSEKIRSSAKKNLAILQAEVDLRQKNAKLLGIKVEKEKESLNTLKKTIKESNKLKAIAKSTGGFLKAIGSGFGKLKSLGVFEMDKEIRNAARSIGVGAKQSKAFSLNLQKAGEDTVYMGVSTKKLAEMQKSYSEEVGRSTLLSQEGLKALADMEAGTGIDGFGVTMASSMDKFGASVKTSRDLVQETVDYAKDIGVNAAKAAEMTSKSLKLAQRFRFKGGAKGLAKMATEALKLRIDMDAMAGVADKVFRPEGAIKMAAELQTMGGAFAKMADPMQLMFKARNDFAGFSKDIAKASAEFVTFNKETGQFDVKGGAAMDRMREIGTMTGLGADKLQEMAVAQKRIDTIGAVAPVSFSDKDAELISGFATIQEGGGIEIQVDGMTKQVENLTKRDLKLLKSEKESLEKIAKQSRTAENTLDDIKTSFMQLLIPIAEALKKDFAEPLRDLVNDDDFKDSIRSFVTSVSNIVGTVTKFIIKNPFTSIGVAIAGTAAMWVAKGISLGTGFNLVASATGPGSMLGNMGKMAVSVFSSAAAAAAAGVVAGAVAGYSEYTENAEMGMSGGENFGRTAAKTTGAGLGAWGGATLGASIGAAGGPFAPVTVPLGFIVGGLIGGFGGAAVGEAAGDGIYGDENRNSASMRKPKSMRDPKSIPVQDAAIKLGSAQFDERDNFLLASTSKNQLNKSVETITKGSSNSDTVSEVNHKFEKIDINITLNAVGISDDMAKSIINNDSIARGLNTRINNIISSNWNGGISNPKGATV
tara:strand:- start:3272 stop:5803 length:2532 start_codon:yes stop_codon:yes gene_type:complete